MTAVSASDDTTVRRDDRGRIIADDGFWQVFRIQGPKWDAFNNWLKEARAQKFDVQNGEQVERKRTREWKDFLGRNEKELLVECPVVV